MRSERSERLETTPSEGAVIYRLENPTRAYAWGSSTHIPKLLGQPIAEEPVAEMWLGAHPADPSRLPDGRTLEQAIQDDPVAILGQRVHESFGPRLPFLLKLLAAREPLSLQVHPTSERARIRFAEQSAAGIPLDAPHRSYQDASHKPELIFALTRFEGMAGFRDPVKTAEILRRIDLPWLDEFADRIGSTRTAFQTLRAVTSEMLATNGPVLTERLQELKSAAQRAEHEAHRPPVRRRRPFQDPSDVERESIRVYAALPDLIDRYPHDAGVLVTLLLNHVVLAAGDAMFIDAGVIHAYTSGFGVEIMASSDNVLRAGLTPKHVDIPELLSITNFTPMPPPLWGSEPLGDAQGVALRPPVGEFELVIATPRAAHVEMPATDPQIALCLDGRIDVETADAREHLVQGQAVFVPAGQSRLTLTGRGRVALARPGV